MDYILHLGILICIYTILSQSLSLVAGYSGQISLAHAGFYGIGWDSPNSCYLEDEWEKATNHQK